MMGLLIGIDRFETAALFQVDGPIGVGRTGPGCRPSSQPTVNFLRVAAAFDE